MEDAHDVVKTGPLLKEPMSVKDEPLLAESMKEESTPPASTKPMSKEPQLIDHLPVAREEAMKTFVEITANHYQYGTLGLSREAGESMTCDCVYEHGVDSPWIACGDGSDCINRLTQVECLPDDCRCGTHCLNQRFQRHDYAPIDIVKTEKKGFGLRAGADLEKDDFIYEYVGDVISHPSFAKRMREYAEEGIRHFYFMMLQKDEYIDATKRGGIGRFANHSCNPNCYVAKWTIGDHVRMGIFANRTIKKNEELTFNYNVDRYGHEAQPCYCGGAKCIGFIGGKTQTDLAAMDDLYLDALGITEEVNRLGLKGSKKRKSKKLDEDFVPDLKPLVEKDVAKMVQAMRQTQSRKVMFKLLTRIKISEDTAALRLLMRLRVFSAMKNIMGDYENDEEMQLLGIQCMTALPLIYRNKVDDSRVNIPVQACTQSGNEALKTAAQRLLDKWATLETIYRIPKRNKETGESYYPILPPGVFAPPEEDPRPAKRSKLDDLVEVDFDIKPLGFSAVKRPARQPRRPPSPPPDPLVHAAAANYERYMTVQATRAELAAIISAAAAKEAARAAEAEAKAKADAEKDEGLTVDREEKERRRKERKEKEKNRREEKEANMHKRLLKLISPVVVRTMSRHRARMDVDVFKKHAKELTHILADKEKKSQDAQKNSKYESLSDDTIHKIQKFARDYTFKIISRLEKQGQLTKRDPKSSSGSAGSSSRLKPSTEHRINGRSMSPEEAMYMNGGGRIDEHEEDRDETPGDDERTPVEPAESDTSTAVATDPRKRGWSAAWDAKDPVRDADGDLSMREVGTVGIAS